MMNVTRALSRKSQCTISNQFTLDFVPPFSYTYMALFPNLGGWVNEAARRRSL